MTSQELPLVTLSNTSSTRAPTPLPLCDSFGLHFHSARAAPAASAATARETLRSIQPQETASAHACSSPRAATVGSDGGLEQACAELASGQFTGGMLETLLCDVIWRLWRPVRLQASKPRLPSWTPESSGRIPLDACAIFRGTDTTPTIVNLHAFLQEWCAPPPGGGPPSVFERRFVRSRGAPATGHCPAV